ncbi:hypothetical protein AAHC03_019208 [Spirometra sp. Aus1]
MEKTKLRKQLTSEVPSPQGDAPNKPPKLCAPDQWKWQSVNAIASRDARLLSSRQSTGSPTATGDRTKGKLSARRQPRGQTDQPRNPTLRPAANPPVAPLPQPAKLASAPTPGGTTLSKYAPLPGIARPSTQTKTSTTDRLEQLDLALRLPDGLRVQVKAHPQEILSNLITEAVAHWRPSMRQTWAPSCLRCLLPADGPSQRVIEDLRQTLSFLAIVNRSLLILQTIN